MRYVTTPRSVYVRHKSRHTLPDWFGGFLVALLLIAICAIADTIGGDPLGLFL